MASPKRRRWRIRNFVIREVEVPTLGESDWSLSENQVRQRVKKGEIGVVETLEICNLEGSWAVRIQPLSIMHNILSAILSAEGYAENEWLDLILNNMYWTSLIPNAYYHQGVCLLLGAYFDPELIKGGLFSRKSRAFFKDARELRDKFLAWHREASLSQEGDDTEVNEQDLKALQAREVLGE